jgi:hypothetical protein
MYLSFLLEPGRPLSFYPWGTNLCDFGVILAFIDLFPAL